MPRYRIDLAYDGTAFRGYAHNPGVRTVQGELERALSTVTGEQIDSEVAGRTDAGVHARHNVVAFTVGEPIAPTRVQRSLLAMLAPEIVAAAVTEVRDGFSPRFDATSRRYRYFVENTPVPDPMLRWRAWHVPDALDLDAMNAAAAGFVGEHDFASLCRRAEGRSTVRTIAEAAWTDTAGLLVYEVLGTSFCHQMVRSMVALCVEIGRGRVGADAVPGILEARDRNAARGAAPPQGLTLWDVEFDEV